jgi:hypothetical protein
MKLLEYIWVLIKDLSFWKYILYVVKIWTHAESLINKDYDRNTHTKKSVIKFVNLKLKAHFGSEISKKNLCSCYSSKLILIYHLQKLSFAP